MLRTPFSELFELEAPILQAAIWPATSPELVAAVSDAGGLGSIGAVNLSADDVRARIERVRELTDRPFAVNHVVPRLTRRRSRSRSRRGPRRCRSRSAIPASWWSVCARSARRRCTRSTRSRRRARPPSTAWT